VADEVVRPHGRLEIEPARGREARTLRGVESGAVEDEEMQRVGIGKDAAGGEPDDDARGVEAQLSRTSVRVLPREGVGGRLAQPLERVKVLADDAVRGEHTTIGEME